MMQFASADAYLIWLWEHPGHKISDKGLMVMAPPTDTQSMPRKIADRLAPPNLNPEDLDDRS